jgi:hypothetical protein
VSHHKSRDTADLVCPKAMIDYECHRLQPELGHGPLPLHMDVRRFPAVGAEENEPIRSITKYGRHRATFLAHMFYTQRKDFTQKRAKWLLKPNALGVKRRLAATDTQPATAPPTAR